MRGPFPRCLTCGLVLALLGSSATPARAAGDDWRDPVERPSTFEERRDEGRLSVDELRKTLPGMEAADGLPVLRLTPGLRVDFPYQILGVGTGVELVPTRFVRLGLAYSIGISLTREKAKVSHYGEGLLGLRLFGLDGESRTTIRLGLPRPGLRDERPALKAWVPSYHALFVEGGMVTGFIGLEPCVDACPVDVPRPATDERQLFFPVAGLRYVYFSDVRSARAKVRSRALFSLFAHAVGKPLHSPSTPRYFPNGNEAGAPGYGGRVGAEIPPFGRCLASIAWGTGCASAALTLGYAPYPRIFWADLGVLFPLH
jgi:hypothetical protein